MVGREFPEVRIAGTKNIQWFVIRIHRVECIIQSAQNAPGADDV
jgi:hypothetical protein